MPDGTLAGDQQPRPMGAHDMLLAEYKTQMSDLMHTVMAMQVNAKIAEKRLAAAEKRAEVAEKELATAMARIADLESIVADGAYCGRNGGV